MRCVRVFVRNDLLRELSRSFYGYSAYLDLKRPGGTLANIILIEILIMRSLRGR